MLQALQQFVLDYDLPKRDMTLFAISCPYCGKSDRIRQLESPDELHQEMEPEIILKYKELWAAFEPSTASLGVCKFCRNILGISLNIGKAKPLVT